MPPLNRLPDSLEVGDCFWWLQRYCKLSGNGKKKQRPFSTSGTCQPCLNMSQRFSKPCPRGVLWDPWFRGWIHLRTCPAEPSAATAFWSHPSCESVDENAVLSDRWAKPLVFMGRGLLWIGTYWDTASTIGLGAARSQELVCDFPAVFADPVMDFQSNHCAMIPPHFTPARIGWFSPEKQSFDARIAVRTTESEHWGGGRRQRRDLGMDLRFRWQKHGDSQW